MITKGLRSKDERILYIGGVVENVEVEQSVEMAEFDDFPSLKRTHLFKSHKSTIFDGILRAFCLEPGLFGLDNRVFLSTFDFWSHTSIHAFGTSITQPRGVRREWF